ncbi:MAG: hypothetical protein IKW30_06090 [Lachnospiraceae bacterium]|nr:hypothetical protein [Lachnospiraceae bacterium]
MRSNNNKKRNTGSFAGLGRSIVIGFIVFKVIQAVIFLPQFMETQKEINASQKRVEGYGHSQRVGFIDMDMDGIPDENIDMTDPYIRNMVEIWEVKAKFIR